MKANGFLVRDTALMLNALAKLGVRDELLTRNTIYIRIYIYIYTYYIYIYVCVYVLVYFIYIYIYTHTYIKYL